MKKVLSLLTSLSLIGTGATTAYTTTSCATGTFGSLGKYLGQNVAVREHIKKYVVDKVNNSSKSNLIKLNQEVAVEGATNQSFVVGQDTLSYFKEAIDRVIAEESEIDEVIQQNTIEVELYWNSSNTLGSSNSSYDDDDDRDDDNNYGRNNNGNDYGNNGNGRNNNGNGRRYDDLKSFARATSSSKIADGTVLDFSVDNFSLLITYLVTETDDNETERESESIGFYNTPIDLGILASSNISTRLSSIEYEPDERDAFRDFQEELTEGLYDAMQRANIVDYQNNESHRTGLVSEFAYSEMDPTNRDLDLLITDENGNEIANVNELRDNVQYYVSFSGNGKTTIGQTQEFSFSAQYDD